MSALKELIHCSCPFPFILHGEPINGLRREQPKYCRDKCDTHDCEHFTERFPKHQTCSHGFSCYVFSAAKQKLIINGLIAAKDNTVITGERRKALQRYVTNQEELAAGMGTIEKVCSLSNSLIQEGTKDGVALLHDIKTSVGIVLSWCQEMINTAPGDTFEEKLNAASFDMRNLFGSINLLREQLELADVIANPDAITYGQMNPSSLTGFWYRMVKLFEPRATTAKLAINFNAHRNEVKVRAYNSIQFLPLILLDNAIKYSFRNKTIYVELSLSEANLSIAVSSYGKTVPIDYREKIFEKHIRGPNGTEANPEGMGMGLYIAKMIAAAHGYKLYYVAPYPDLTVGNNKFVLEIPRSMVLAEDRPGVETPSV